MRPLYVLVFCAFTMLFLNGSRAQNLPSKQQPVPVQQLDQLYLQKDWNRLGAALYPGPDQDAFSKSVQWLQKKVDSGGNFFMAMLLARDYWDISKATNVADTDLDDVDRDPRMTAGMLSLYAYAQIEIDGAECGDATSVSHRMDQLISDQVRNVPISRELPTGGQRAHGGHRHFVGKENGALAWSSRRVAVRIGDGDVHGRWASAGSTDACRTIRQDVSRKSAGRLEASFPVPRWLQTQTGTTAGQSQDRNAKTVGRFRWGP